MTKFTGTFVHTVEQTYEFEIEAETKEEAEQLLDEDPFGYVKNNLEPVDEQGLEIGKIQFDEPLPEE